MKNRVKELGNTWTVLDSVYYPIVLLQSPKKGKHSYYAWLKVGEDIEVDAQIPRIKRDLEDMTRWPEHADNVE